MATRTGIAGVTALLIAVTALALPRQRGLAAAAQGVSDSTYATDVLAAVRGATPLACEMLLRSVGTGWWGSFARQPDTRTEFRERLRWMANHTSDPSSVVPLRRGLEDPDPCVRRVAARVLGRNRHPSAGAALLDALRSTNAETRRLGALGLGHAERRDAADPLIDALRDGAPPVRAAAAWALGEVEDPRATPHLVALLERDTVPAVRRAAAWALGSLH